jgi:hypothetical protein
MKNDRKWMPKSSDQKRKNAKQSETSNRTHKPEHTKMIRKRKGDKKWNLGTN